MSDPHRPPAPPTTKPPGAPGPERPAPQGPVDLEGARVAIRGALRFGLLLLATVVASSLPLPWTVLALALTAYAVVVGIRALRGARRARVGGAVVPAIIVGLVMSAFLVLQTLGTIVAWNVQMDYQECMAGAITGQAAEGCVSARESSIEQWIDDLRPSP